MENPGEPGKISTAMHNVPTELTRIDVRAAARRVAGVVRETALAPFALADERIELRLGPAPVDDRLEGSLATATWAMANGAAMVRVHDVRPTAQAALVIAGQITTKDAAA